VGYPETGCITEPGYTDHITDWRYTLNVKTLIDKASKNTVTRYALAKTLGVSPAQVYDWEEGRKSCSPEDRARLAAVAGEEAMQELVRGILEKHEGTLRGEQLARVLGKSSRQIGGVRVSELLSLASLSYGISLAIRCIEVLNGLRHFDRYSYHKIG